LKGSKPQFHHVIIPPCDVPAVRGRPARRQLSDRASSLKHLRHIQVCRVGSTRVAQTQLRVYRCWAAERKESASKPSHRLRSGFSTEASSDADFRHSTLGSAVCQKLSFEEQSYRRDFCGAKQGQERAPVLHRVNQGTALLVVRSARSFSFE